MTAWVAPIRIVDIAGSVAMIVLAFMCLGRVAKLKDRDPDDVIWTYLFLVCLALAGFAISRSAGHLLKQVLLAFGRKGAWEAIRPISGSVNTVMFVVVGSVTLYFERSWRIYRRILQDKRALQAANEESMYLNRNLEKLVAERTQALEISMHKYRRIFEVSRDMIAVTTLDGAILDMNPAGLKMLGLEGGLAGGEKMSAFFEDAREWEGILEKIEAVGFVSSEEIRLECVDGSSRRALAGAGLDRGGDGGRDTLHFLIKDVEERRSMERQIAQADKLASIGQLSAGIAHEINNPLGVILGYTQLLLRGEKEDSERFGDLKTIEKHVRACKAIVEDLLNFARGSKPSREPISMNDALEEVVSFVRHHSRLDGVRILRDYDESIPAMTLDEKKIKQVFMNLLMNAGHAVGERGTISLSTRCHPDAGHVVVEIADDGCGIEEKNLSRVFEPFFTTKPTGEGTGLGLSVSYGIVKNHGGDIVAESEPGKGAIFSVILPENPSRTRMEESLGARRGRANRDTETET